MHAAPPFILCLTKTDLFTFNHPFKNLNLTNDLRSQIYEKASFKPNAAKVIAKERCNNLLTLGDPAI